MTTIDSTRTLVHVDPTSIVLDTNVRADARLDKAFLASIRDHGVMQPVVGYRDDDGAVHVLQGQRRTLAAVETQRETIPVYLADTPDEAGRIITQMIENDQRTGFTDAERADGYEQLSLLGLSASQIAKRTHSRKESVEQGLAARKSQTARDHLASGLTIEQAAVLAEFDDDEEAIDSLVQSAQRGGFEHTASRLRQRREAARAVAAEVDRLTAEGITVLDETPWDYYYDGRGAAAPLRALDADEEQHTTCPGHAVIVTATWAGEAQTQEVCTDWKANGHKNHEAAAGSSGPLNEDEKAERRRVIEGNKEWRAATDVRRDWLRTFTQRKSAPKDAAATLARLLAQAPSRVHDGMNDRKGITTDLMGEGWRTSAPASSARASVYALTIALAGIEVIYADVQTWRNMTDTDLDYLAVLVAWGYTPCDLEQGLLDARTEQ
ncbi:ParB N-terminal domain-containing protein [uncultured Brachybacterium sp.]|uniref:ParB/RepB/Spo0J family partition protein n=1 Tax=uncultured Brachybacterium sp. TaxID=189680 RepID=UPI002624BDC4|nr:ParB N-terminal domain-containing protein [uncultured Brachybacterium sp.]